MEQDEGVDAPHLGQRPAGRLLERAAVVRLHEVRDDLGVGLGHEAVAAGGEPRLELQVVLDDAVVDDDDAPAQSWCGCAFSSVGRPWVAQRGVADPPLAREGEALRGSLRGCRASPPSAGARSRRPSPPRGRPSRIRGTPTGAGVQDDGTASRPPTYPTMPHILDCPPASGAQPRLFSAARRSRRFAAHPGFVTWRARPRRERPWGRPR